MIKPDTCTWTGPDSCESWEAGCGNDFVLFDSGPEDNGFKFCPFCGKPLVQAPSGSEAPK